MRYLPARAADTTLVAADEVGALMICQIESLLYGDNSPARSIDNPIVGVHTAGMPLFRPQSARSDPLVRETGPETAFR